MTDLMLIFFLCLLGAECWLRRQQSELAERLIRHYCHSQNWQVLSVYRKSFGVPLLLTNFLQRRNTFVFEYSPDGLASQESELYLTGLQLPIFRDAVTPRQTLDDPDVPHGVVIQMPTAHASEQTDHHDTPKVTEPTELHENNVIQFPRHHRS